MNDDGYEMARSILNGGPDIAVAEWIPTIMCLGAFKGCSYDPETELVRVTDGERSAIYKVVERHGVVLRLRWPD